MWYVLLAIAVFGLVTSSVFTGMTLVAVPRFLRERRTAEAKLRERPGFVPALSVLKPLAGAEPDLEKHLASFSEQDYPEFEILFCARKPEDAGLEIARRVAARYPHVAVQFFATGEPKYINAKVASMELMEKSARHDILVISDSDVRVTPDYLRAVALPFADERVGGMCCLYRGIAAGGGLWARLEAVGMSVEMTAGVLVARMMEGMQFVLGPTMSFRRDVIGQMGGFKVTADYCADDFVLGNETHKLGREVVLSHHAIDHIVINLSLVASLKHQVRWMKSTRFSRPKGHFGTALTFSMPFGLVGLAAGVLLGHVWWGVGLLAWAIASREALSVAVGRMVVRDPSWFNLLVLYPVRDLMGFFFWAASYMGSRILWRGRVFQLLPGGKMRAAE
ncbi:glycosyltransferase [Occallatibacter savannae]|uniref:glycosyltransferase n=1 Tax=Occallatibacter savannae TaxID=1002691 RepID=UPI000D68599E|nr:glycosyltransferase [Occallatibacter savannae]